ncbi:hypothetical protein MNV_500005 [Candidatus Methanoperedens nitroreducens]|uniref:Uncharacterized protein n=1 Tax=Candidatus Methanoperedens nitratireducens TaxID=1392998 RepID=A0A284VRM9_9EURY|nr:hypothetical protein MNV_500005 [Candidatus Methanoperedens nitroreducens]
MIQDWYSLRTSVSLCQTVNLKKFKNELVRTGTNSGRREFVLSSL